MSKRKPWFDGRQMVRDIPRTAIKDCTHAGACDGDVEYWVSKLHFDADPRLLAEYLRGFGAWDSEELADHDANRRRAFWTICGYLVDDPSYPAYLES